MMLLLLSLQTRLQKDKNLYDDIGLCFVTDKCAKDGMDLIVNHNLNF